MELECSQYKIIVESSPVIIWRIKPDGTLDYMNAKGAAFTGRKMEEDMDEHWLSRVHPEDAAYCHSVFSQAAEKSEPFKMAFRMQRQDDEWRWINAIGQPFFNEGHSFMGYIGCCTDITEQMAWEQLQYMAQNDGLTGIRNRQFFEQLAYDEVERSKRYSTSLCAVMIDIDRFKEINDTYGHMAGDKILQGFARLLADNIRTCDILGRYGGDEFIIMLPHTSLSEAKAMMDRICALLKDPLQLDYGKTLAITCSYGVVELEKSDTLELLEARADSEMYGMKNKTK